MTTLQLPTFVPRPRLLTALRLLMLLGILGTLAGLFVALKLTLGGLLLGAFYILSLGLAAMSIIAMDYVTKAGWSAALRRIPESMVATLPVSCLIVLLVLAGGFTRLYPWGHDHGAHRVDASLTLWRTQWFFLVRAAICMAIWLLFAWLMLRNSRRQDATGNINLTHRNVRLSGAFFVVFALTLSLASFDWLMGLQGHWFSTMFGAYQFFGLFEAGLATIAVAVILLRRAGYLVQIVGPAHLHDLGKYLFCFCTFWGYIWFCQYMLIWYANIPEETSYFILRHADPWWLTMAVASVALNWAIPFFVLLPAAVKRNERMLLRVSVLVLIGHWVDLYGTVTPPLAEPSQSQSLWPVIPSLLLLPLFVLVMLRALRNAPLLPMRDPMLVESLHHH